MNHRKLITITNLLKIPFITKIFLFEKKNITDKLSKFWINRWVSNRILSKDVLNAMMKHDYSYPITHGWRVRLPDSDKQLDFWEKNDADY